MSARRRDNNNNNWRKTNGAAGSAVHREQNSSQNCEPAPVRRNECAAAQETPVEVELDMTGLQKASAIIRGFWDKDTAPQKSWFKERRYPNIVLPDIALLMFVKSEEHLGFLERSLQRRTIEEGLSNKRAELLHALQDTMCKLDLCRIPNPWLREPPHLAVKPALVTFALGHQLINSLTWLVGSFALSVGPPSFNEQPKDEVKVYSVACQRGFLNDWTRFMEEFLRSQVFREVAMKNFMLKTSPVCVEMIYCKELVELFYEPAKKFLKDAECSLEKEHLLNHKVQLALPILKEARKRLEADVAELSGLYKVYSELKCGQPQFNPVGKGQLETAELTSFFSKWSKQVLKFAGTYVACMLMNFATARGAAKPSEEFAVETLYPGFFACHQYRKNYLEMAGDAEPAFSRNNIFMTQTYVLNNGYKQAHKLLWNVTKPWLEGDCESGFGQKITGAFRPPSAGDSTNTLEWPLMRPWSADNIAYEYTAEHALMNCFSRQRLNLWAIPWQDIVGYSATQPDHHAFLDQWDHLATPCE